MIWQGWVEIAVYAALITAAVKPLGGYIAVIVTGEARIPHPLAAIEGAIYRLAGVDPTKEQSWVGYAFALLWFHLFGIAALYLLQRVQGVLPFNPQAFDAVAPDHLQTHRFRLPQLGDDASPEINAKIEARIEKQHHRDRAEDRGSDHAGKTAAHETYRGSVRDQAKEVHWKQTFIQ
jgi:hypothetical protein